MTHLQESKFFGNLQRALDRTGAERKRFEDLITIAPGENEIQLMETIRNRTRKKQLELVERMTTAGQAINTRIVSPRSAPHIATDILELADQKETEWGDQKSIVGWNHPIIQKLALDKAAVPMNIPVYTAQNSFDEIEEKEFRHRAEKALIGITSADYGLADTATITMKNRKGQPLYVSLLPSIHVVIIRWEQILANLKEFYTLLKWNPEHKAEGITDTMTLISGPSKTADIEATLVHGAHGPRELVIYIME